MPNQGVPVIFKNKIAYGYAEKSVQAYDVSVSDYNALTEQQQLDGSIRFIQGVDAIPNGSNVWAKLGTTPLAEGLPRDCSQAVNELKSNLTDKATMIFNDNTTFKDVIIMPLSVPLVCTNGDASINLSSHAKTGYAFSSMAFCQVQDTTSLSVTGCSISGTTATVKLANRSFTGTVYGYLLCFLVPST